MLTELQKSQELINKSRNILIIPQEELCGDSLGSALALHEGLKKIENNIKNPETHLPPNIPSRLEFLLPEEQDKKPAKPLKRLIISINNNLDKINTLQYKKEGGKLQVIFSLDHDYSIKKEDIIVQTMSFNYDLIITLDAPNLTMLGKIYETNPELFDNAPIINIDHHENNWLFGNANLVNTKASSTAEVVIDFLNFLKVPLNESCATCLLCGIIEKTQSFHKPQTTPGTFRVASELLSKGAKQELIIQHLYKTKPLDIVKLWGRVMTNIKYDNRKKIISSFITANMLQEINTDASTIKHLLKELKENFLTYSHFLILWESKDNTHAIFATKNTGILESISSRVNGKIKNGYVVFQMPEKNLYKSEARIFNLMQSIL